MKQSLINNNNTCNNTHLLGDVLHDGGVRARCLALHRAVPPDGGPFDPTLGRRRRLLGRLLRLGLLCGRPGSLALRQLDAAALRPPPEVDGALLVGRHRRLEPLARGAELVHLVTNRTPTTENIPVWATHGTATTANIPRGRPKERQRLRMFPEGDR
eukprot:1190774-Prorocentrum_minimum.AAC.5